MEDIFGLVFDPVQGLGYCYAHCSSAGPSICKVDYVLSRDYAYPNSEAGHNIPFLLEALINYPKEGPLFEHCRAALIRAVNEHQDMQRTEWDDDVEYLARELVLAP